MFGFLLVLLVPVLLVALARRNREPQPIVNLMLAAYGARMVLQFFVRDLPLFSHGGGGDCIFYERMALSFSRLWSYGGVEFYTAERVPEVGNAALPINLFAFIIYLNGGETRAGCTAAVALCAILACYLIYRVAVDLDVDPEKCRKVLALTLFLPGYLFYTADMYKDGIVLFFVVAAFTSALRLASRFNLGTMIFTAIALWGLWYVRHYLVFLVLLPIMVGLVGLGKGSVARQLIMGAGAILAAVLLSRSSFVADMFSNAQNTFERATNNNAILYNASGGSGVSFDDGGQAFGAIHLKVLYTLFSPFPWMLGSFGLQFGKLDTMVWYYMVWRASKVGRVLWRKDRPLLLMFLSFLIPLTIAYATTMANVGLIFRQRFPIVFIGILLGTLSWSRLFSNELRIPQ